MKTLTNKGFSLIELMVVVAIMGVLAAIGIPQYSKFQAKARQSEARSHLSAIYTGETSFKSEFNNYSVDLFNIGVQITGNQLRYTAGFAGGAACSSYATATANGAPAEVTTRTQAHSPGVHDSGGNTVTWHSSILTAGGAAVTLNSTPACAEQTFLASVTGDPRASPAAIAGTSDTWTINQNKQIANSVSGL